MELLSPGGTKEKARLALLYGADAVYLGIPGFSLRAGAEPDLDHQALRDLKKDFPQRRLYGALNRFVLQKDMGRLKESLQELRAAPLDALIVADAGLLEPIRSILPEIELHLSTQANCTNSGAARLYHQMGFSRIVPARELTLPEIREIKDAVPDLELEVFVHGAMCMAYSGRCFLSQEMTGRSANQGDCAHSCRWHYAVVEEQRPGEYYPVQQDQDYLAIFSARDLMLLDALQEIRTAGVSAIKIEGRMKSALYAAIATRAYRTALDQTPDAPRWREELFRLPHRPYSGGFLLEDRTVHEPARESGGAGYRLMAILGEAPRGEPVPLTVKNTVYRDTRTDLLLPNGSITPLKELDLRDSAGHLLERATQKPASYLAPPAELAGQDLRGGILRSCAEGYPETVASRR
ncbi:putative protease [Alkalispirochaeta americana]|uniref:Putative protease n=1 Tax=Alkalispirochaeta americana TaxID=159291 RepID=A0A1N6V285_9SPIO|nr:U32 family peptidase [Alkalispirochaeta americana]SIQ71892.1 putative protease [Alkalispirochaeta americana]